jgi:paraquat-inducible protein B
MSEPDNGGPRTEPLDDGIPSARVAPRRLRTLPWFWIIPIIAILVGAGLALNALYDQGPTIHIQFANAEGLEAGKTKVRYKSVEIGMVKSIHLSADARNVDVGAQITRDAAKLLVKDARFWVVRTRFAAGQLSGIGTLVSGSFIGMDVGRSNQAERNFIGLEAPPTIMTDEPGREFVLSGGELGSLDVGAPVYYRRFVVGQVTSLKLNDDGAGVTLHVFVREPYVRFVAANARFWQASGVDLTVDANGAHLQTPSLISMLFGGVAFQVPVELSPSGQAAPDQIFTLYPNQQQAMRHVSTAPVSLTAYFDESVRGLAVGATVDFRGVTVGEVHSLEVEFDPDHGRARFKAVLNLDADRFAPNANANANPNPKGDANAAGEASGRSLLERALKHGLRAQLRSGNLLTGARYVALDFFPAATGGPAPRGEIGTVPGDLEDLQRAITSIAEKLDHVPFQQIAADLHSTLNSLQRTLDETDTAVHTFNGTIAPELSATLAAARDALNHANQLLSSGSPIQEDVREALHEMSRAATSLRQLADQLQRHPESLLRGNPAAAPGDHP